MIDESLVNHPQEFIFVLLELLTQIFGEAKVSLGEGASRLKEALENRIDKKVADQLYEKHLQ